MEKISTALQKVKLQQSSLTLDLPKHSGKIKHEKFGKKPVFVHEELYFSTDLVYTEVHIKCKELGVKKMLNIPDLTIQGWYVEFLKAGWDIKKFNERLNAMIHVECFGGVLDIQKWFEAEELFTSNIVQKKIDDAIKQLVEKGDEILQGKEIELEVPIDIDLEPIKVSVARKVELYYKHEKLSLTQELIDLVLDKLITEHGYENKFKYGERRSISKRTKHMLSYWNEALTFGKQTEVERLDRKKLSKEERREREKKFEKIVMEEAAKNKVEAEQFLKRDRTIDSANLTVL